MMTRGPPLATKNLLPHLAVSRIYTFIGHRKFTFKSSFETLQIEIALVGNPCSSRKFHQLVVVGTFHLCLLSIKKVCHGKKRAEP